MLVQSGLFSILLIFDAGKFNRSANSVCDNPVISRDLISSSRNFHVLSDSLDGASLEVDISNLSILCVTYLDQLFYQIYYVMNLGIN